MLDLLSDIINYFKKMLPKQKLALLCEFSSSEGMIVDNQGFAMLLTLAVYWPSAPAGAE